MHLDRVIGTLDSTKMLAYTRGVLDGDGSIVYQQCNAPNCHCNPRLTLESASRAFVEKFRVALTKLGLQTNRIEERNRIRNGFNGYSFHYRSYRVQIRCNIQLVKRLIAFKPKTNDEMLSYLIGFYESEGSLSIKKYKNRECWNWRVHNKNTQKLNMIASILQKFGIAPTFRSYQGRTSFLEIQRKVDIERLIVMGVKKVRA